MTQEAHPDDGGIRVCLDARLDPGTVGGVQNFVAALAHTFSDFPGPDEYLFLTRPGAGDWLAPYVHGPCRVEVVPRPAGSGWRSRARGVVESKFPSVVSAYRRSRPSGSPAQLEDLDELMRGLQCDVVHFCLQTAFRTSLPNLYHPWDLQHVHHPEFFTRRQLATRSALYAQACHQADVVIAPNRWSASDFGRHLSLSFDKVRVVPAAGASQLATTSQAAGNEIRERLSLPERFLLYPATTWPHKNHLGLVREIASLKDIGLEVSVVCTGGQTTFHRNILKEVRARDVVTQFQFVGYVSDADMGALYREATSLVFPTLFEGWGMPVSEALDAGLPIISSDVCGLDELVGESGLVVDLSVAGALADAIARVWTDAGLERELRARAARASRTSWKEICEIHRSIYRSLAERRSSTMREPEARHSLE